MQLDLDNLPAMSQEQHRDNVKRCFTEYVTAIKRRLHLKAIGQALISDGVFGTPDKVDTWLDLDAQAVVDVTEAKADLDHAILWHQAAGHGDVKVTNSKSIRFPGEAVNFSV